MQKTDFKLYPSKCYAFIFGVTLLLSVVVVAALSMKLWLKLIIAVLVIGYGYVTFKRYALLKSPLSVIGVAKQGADRWLISTVSGELYGVLRGDSTVTSLVTILRFDISEQREPLTCLIFKDSLGTDDYRQLVSMLRMS